MEIEELPEMRMKTEGAEGYSHVSEAAIGRSTTPRAFTIGDQIELLEIEFKTTMIYYESYTESISKMTNLEGSGLDALRERLYIRASVLREQIEYLKK